MKVLQQIGLGVVALLGVLACVLLVTILVLQVVVDPNRYKETIRLQAAQQGIELTMRGDVRWSLLPRPALALADLDLVVPVNNTKQPIHIGKLALALDMKSLLTRDVAFSRVDVTGASARFTVDGKPIELLDISLQSQSLNTRGNDFPFTLSGQYTQDHLQAKVQLNAQMSADSASGQFAIPSLEATVLAQGEGIPGGKQTLTTTLKAVQFDSHADTLSVGAITLQVGDVQLTARIAGKDVLHSPVITADPLALSINNMHLNGSLKWQEQGTWGRVVMNLKGDSLDVDHWVAAKPPVLEHVIILPGEYQMTFDTVLANHLTLTNALLAAVVDGKAITLQALQADAYQGRIRNSGSLELVTAQAPKLTLNTSINGLQLAPLLADWQRVPTKVAAGTLQMDSHLEAVALDPPTILRTLSGYLQFSVNGLVMDQFDLERRVCETAAMLDGQPPPVKPWTNRTTFQEMRGTIQIQNGAAYIAPLAAKLEALTLAGQGPFNLLDGTVDVQLDLKLVGDSKTKYFCDTMNPRWANLAWPLRCVGNYAAQDGKELCDIDKVKLEQIVLQAGK